MGGIFKGVTKTLSGIPIIGDMAKMGDTLMRRPGDLVKDPKQLINLAAMLSGAGVIPKIPIGGTLGKVLFNPSTPLEKVGNALINKSSGGMLPLLGAQGMAQQMPGGNPFQTALQDAFISSLMGSGGLTGLMAKPSDAGNWGKAGQAYGSLGALGQNLASTGYGGLLPMLARYAQFTGANDADPYGLNEYQRRHLNRGLDATNMSAEAAIQRLRQNLASRGIYNPAARAAAEERIRMAYDQQRGQLEDAAAMRARDERLGGIQGLMSQFGGLGAQGANLLGQAGQGYQGLGQLYANRDLGWQGSMGSLMGLLMAKNNPQPQFPQLGQILGGLTGSMTPQAQQGLGAPITYGKDLFSPSALQAMTSYAQRKQTKTPAVPFGISPAGFQAAANFVNKTKAKAK